MRKFISFLLLASLLSQCLGSLGVLAWFDTNRDYIAQNLCENKERPWMHCGGQCVLMKKMRKFEEQQQQQSDNSKMRVNKVEWLGILPTSIAFPVVSTLQLTNRYFTWYRAILPDGYVGLPLQPPR
ncbi:hypothetical protein [Olivibacter sitiensis]|uniref:hypothetical protein n=1 Tax=Olivibacter sitiensis TaxID=376470 RepID=UPI00146FB367|nr:hypothetical protein [Olivibacter sitiensis]